jgi:hypothetical protein
VVPSVDAQSKNIQAKKSRAKKWSAGICRQPVIFLPWIFLPSLSSKPSDEQNTNGLNPAAEIRDLDIGFD